MVLLLAGLSDKGLLLLPSVVALEPLLGLSVSAFTACAAPTRRQVSSVQGVLRSHLNLKRKQAITHVQFCVLPLPRRNMYRNLYFVN